MNELATEMGAAIYRYITRTLCRAVFFVKYLGLHEEEGERGKRRKESAVSY